MWYFLLSKYMVLLIVSIRFPILQYIMVDTHNTWLCSILYFHFKFFRNRYAMNIPTVDLTLSWDIHSMLLANSPPISSAYWISNINMSLQGRNNERDGVSNHRRLDCLLSRLFRCRSMKTSKLRVTGLCAENSPSTGEFPAQMASNAENVSIGWRHHGIASDRTVIGNVPYKERASFKCSYSKICKKMKNDHLIRLQLQILKWLIDRLIDWLVNSLIEWYNPWNMHTAHGLVIFDVVKYWLILPI